LKAVDNDALNPSHSKRKQRQRRGARAGKRTHMPDLKPMLEGFALGAGLIFAPGPQSAHLIRQGLARDFALVTAITGFASDCLFVCAGGVSMSAAMQISPGFVLLASWAGVAFVAYWGLRSLLDSTLFAAPALGAPLGGRLSAIRKMLALTWLNPLFYLEISMLCGLAAAYDAPFAQWQFLSAYVAACLVRYLTLCLAVRPFSKWFHKPGTPKAFDRVSGLIMLALAVSLGVTLAGAQ
jgi:L-lysine exporter family protein LysE/ArgO